MSSPCAATGSYLGEGFDDPRPDTLLLVMPISWKGTLQQYVGRLHRLHENKTDVQVYDYADLSVPTLARMHRKRAAGYAALGLQLRKPTPLMLSFNNGNHAAHPRRCRQAAFGRRWRSDPPCPRKKPSH
jgi:superfamily II DNA or RNA helicase